MRALGLQSSFFTVVVCCAAACVVPGRAAAEEASPFLKFYCAECHGGATPDGGLSVEDLRFDAADPASFAKWVRLFDRVRKQEMPPKDQPQPTAAEREAYLKQLETKLHAASLERQLREGRVLVRRLNRNEYQNTLHDLLGITTDLKSLLPDDNTVAGFDNISTGLETSAVHLVRYQAAADKALAEALPVGPILNEAHRWTGRQFLDSRPKPNREGTAPFVRFEGDTLVLCALLYKHGSVTTRAAPIDGRYRIRASVRAVNNEGKPIPVLIGKISSDRFAHERLEHILSIQDAPAGKARVVEVEADLPRGEQIYIEGQGLTFFNDLKKKLDGKPVGDAYAGPGLAVDWIEMEGPLDAGVGYRRLFDALPQVPSRYLADTLAGKPVDGSWKKWPYPGEYSKYPLTPVSRDPQADAARLMRAFLPRAFRRPVSDATAEYFIQVCTDQLAQGEIFGDAMIAGYKAALCSPRFLMLVEKPGALDDFALASRLSYFLWSSQPDDELLAIAARGELRKPDVLKTQTERLLNDRKAERFVANFTGQWLELRKIHDMKPDAMYVEYDEKLAWSMPEETRSFFKEVLRHDLPTSSFLHSDWLMLNERIAKHYGIPNIDGMDFRKVALPKDSHRGGIVTQAGILKLTTNATYTSPVKRGAWILERILGLPPSPPPPNVAAIEPDIRGAVTIREQLALHKSVASCAACHVQIDPPGFALENFDVVGGWRDRYRSKEGGGSNQYVALVNYPERKVWLAKPVEASGETAAGESFRDIDAYKQLLLRDPDQLTRNLAEKLLIYGTGAVLQFSDREAVEQIVAEARAQKHGFRSLIHAVVRSRVFQTK
ncbi:MAG: DUF1592 domain-containing protein [Planctomycetia bacterium]|nr:DUF1592 domain-containing protein [Planctomycetia bacterium]